MGWTNADDRVFGTEAITSIGKRMYDKYALLDHLPSVFINQVGSLAAAAVVVKSDQVRDKHSFAQRNP